MQAFPVHPTLDTMLWGGFSNYAARRMELLKRSGKRERRYQAAFGLMRLYAADGDYARAYEHLMMAKEASPANAVRIQFAILEMEILRNLGRVEEAQLVGFKARKRFEEDPRINVALSSLYDDPERRLNLLSRPLAAAGLARLRRRDANLPLSIHNIAADAPALEDGPLVSVIMPAFNAAATIETAARGILEQTWRNLELIIVDDCSDDDTWAVINRIAEADDRVRPILQPENAGVYRARNAGLAVATGEYLTVNDSDDWSHPQRVEAQMREVSDNQMFNTSHGVRVTEDLTGALKHRSASCFVENTSALLVPTRAAKDLGGWDEVRFSADSDFYFRLMQWTGKKEHRILKLVPLAFILARPESLTNSGATNLRSIHYGARREYKEASAHWRTFANSLTANKGSRPYPIPRVAVDKSTEPVRLYTLLVADMTSSKSLDYLRGAHQDGAVGVLHIPRPANFGKDFDKEARAFIHDNHIAVTVPGQSVECHTVLVPDDRCLEALPDALPSIQADRCVIAGHADVSMLGASEVTRVDPRSGILRDLRTKAAAEALRSGIEMGYDDETLVAIVCRAMDSSAPRPANDQPDTAQLINRKSYVDSKPEIVSLEKEIGEMEEKRRLRLREW